MKSELGIMIQSPFEEFEEWIQKIAENRLPELRKGQFIYNMAYTEFPDQVDLLGYCGIDCFHNDLMIHPFVMELTGPKLWLIRVLRIVHMMQIYGSIF